MEFRRYQESFYRLDLAQIGAQLRESGTDELTLAGQRFQVHPGGSSAGDGRKRLFYRWRLTGESGLVILVMQRATPHVTMPNAIVRATSLQLMRDGTEKVWCDAQAAMEALGAAIVRNKLSRVDVCADLVDAPITEFHAPFAAGWYVMRARQSEEQEVEGHIAGYRCKRDVTSFRVGQDSVRMRVYNKIAEVGSDLQKLELLVARRWGQWNADATRVEFQLRRQKLKDLGVDTVDDWLKRRKAVCRYLTNDWFRMTAGPVDRNHANRSTVHPLWIRVRQAFEEWTGATGDVPLTPLPTLSPAPPHLIRQAIGLLISVLARMRREIDSNDAFITDVFDLISEHVCDRDMANEVYRRALELGAIARQIRGQAGEAQP